MADYSVKEYKDIVDVEDEGKITFLEKIIPADVVSIIDIGCGNGLITNELSKKYKTLGVDINEAKLKFVTGEKLVSSCTEIPRPDRSFDLVFSSELLEHLDHIKFKQTTAEFTRLTEKYILLTVPYKESLEKLFVKCDACKTIYNKNGHLRQFDEENLEGLFQDFNLQGTFLHGRKIRGYNRLIGAFKRLFTPPDAWISGSWQKNQKVSNSYCTTCGYKNEIIKKFHLFTFIFDTLNLLVSKKRHSQIIALYIKK